MKQPKAAMQIPEKRAMKEPVLAPMNNSRGQRTLSRGKRQPAEAGYLTEAAPKSKHQSSLRKSKMNLKGKAGALSSEESQSDRQRSLLSDDDNDFDSEGNIYSKQS